jgi:hypothetical protein
VVTSAALSLLGEYSYSNNWSKKIFGLYMYSSGSQRQPITIMSHLGLSESYDAITGKKRKRCKKSSDLPPANSQELTPSTAPEDLFRGGSLRQLSSSMIDMARAVAATGLFGTLYDNINMVFHAAEQIVGRTGEI